MSDLDWRECRVGDLIERHFCGPSPDCEERPIFENNEWGVLKTTAITWAGWDETAHKVLPKAFWNQPKLEVQSGDVLVTKAGPRHRVGVVCHVPSTRRQLIVSGKMIGLRPRSDLVEPSVLAGLIARRRPQKYIQDRTTGMAESQVNFANGVLLNAPVSVPPRPEQQLISKILDTLDTAIHETEAIIAKLKSVKQGLLHDLLTRGIDANGELRPPQSEAPHLYKPSPLGWIPKEWSAVELNDLVDSKRPIVYGILMPGYGWPGGVPVVKVKDIVDGQIQVSDLLLTSPRIDREYSRSRLNDGDLLFTIRGTVGRTAFVPAKLQSANITQDTARLAIKGLDSRFVRAYLEAPRVARFIAIHTLGVAVQGINLRDVRCIPIARPAAFEATEIANRLDALSERLGCESQDLGKLKLAKSGLMDDLLTGRIRVTSLLSK